MLRVGMAETTATESHEAPSSNLELGIALLSTIPSSL